MKVDRGNHRVPRVDVAYIRIQIGKSTSREVAHVQPGHVEGQRRFPKGPRTAKWVASRRRANVAERQRSSHGVVEVPQPYPSAYAGMQPSRDRKSVVSGSQVAVGG